MIGIIKGGFMDDTKNYVVYHLHDFTSNCNGYMDSTTDYKKYIKLAKKSGMKAIAFSNHGGIYDWVKKKQLCDKAGIKYIHGVETYMCTEYSVDERGYHLGLYARNLDGVKEINKIISESTKKGVLEDNSDRHFYHNPRVSMSDIMKTSNNVIVTTACLVSILWRKRDSDDGYVEKFLNWLSDNSERCFLEVQYHTLPDQIEYNKILLDHSKKYNIRLIAGTDTHSGDEYDSQCRLILQKAKNPNYNESEDVESKLDLSWKTYDELVDKFRAQNCLQEDVYLDAINNTNVMADMVEDFKLDYTFKYPALYKGKGLELWAETIKRKFKDKIDNGIIKKQDIKQYYESIKEEFDAMKGQNMQDFMLFMSEVVDYCMENNIPYGFCRGSVGGSMIAYITDITDVDPIVWGTVFSRFCNADRISLADIDIDFAPEDRVRVYEYIMDRFTRENTSYILTLSTLKDRGIIDTLAMGLGYDDLELVAKIKDDFDKILSDYSELVQEEVNVEELFEEKLTESQSIDFDNHALYVSRMKNDSAIRRLDSIKKRFDEMKNDNQDLFYYFDGLKNCVVAKGNHPAGMIGSPISLPDNLGVHYKNGDSEFPISSCSMKAVDSLNYVKFDILGLKNIGILKDVYRYIGSEYLKSHQIDWNDENVWRDMIKSPVGIFQFQGDFAFSLLKEFEPSRVNDMSLVNASLRPSGKSYRDRLISGEFNKNPSEEIDELLKLNNGFLVYQEDTIKFLTDICDFSGSLADTTRRAIGKKDDELLKEQLPKILEGYCNHSSKPREIAEQEAIQFVQIIQDSSEYQFGLNHSTGYSMIGYALARLRYYHPLEFTTAYLNRADENKHMLLGVALAEQLGIEIKQIEFGKSHSQYMFDRDENSIYKGIGSIKYCNDTIAEELLLLANENQYDNIVDIIIDIITKTSVNSRQLEILGGLGFFRKYGKNKYILDVIKRVEKLHGRKQISIKQIGELNINVDLLTKYSNKKTEKIFKEIDFVGYLKEDILSIEDKPMTVRDQVIFENDYLGYVKFCHNKFPKNYYVITEYKVYKNEYKPYITLHNLNNGEEIKTKIKNEMVFIETPIKLFDVIRVNKFDMQYKTKNVGGKWIKTNEKEKILCDYEVY